MKVNIKRRSLFVAIMSISIVAILLFNSIFLIVSSAETNQSVTYQYDNLGRVLKAIYPDGSIADYTYDKNGNIKSVTITQSKDTTEKQSSTEKQPENSTEKKPESSTEKKPENSTEKQPENSTEKKPENSTEKKPENSTEKTPENNSSELIEKNNNINVREGNTTEAGSSTKEESHPDKPDEVSTQTGTDSSKESDKGVTDGVTVSVSPVYTEDELSLINAFKRSCPTIKSLKLTKSKSDYFINIKINKMVKGSNFSYVGYQIRYSDNSKFKKSKTLSVKQSSKSKLTDKRWKVAKNKTYYVKVRAFVENKAGRKVYSKYSKVKVVNKKN